MGLQIFICNHQKLRVVSRRAKAKPSSPANSLVHSGFFSGDSRELARQKNPGDTTSQARSTSPKSKLVTPPNQAMRASEVISKAKVTPQAQPISKNGRVAIRLHFDCWAALSKFVTESYVRQIKHNLHKQTLFQKSVCELNSLISYIP